MSNDEPLKKTRNRNWESRECGLRFARRPRGLTSLACQCESGVLEGGAENALDARGEGGPFLLAGSKGFLAGQCELVVFAAAAVDFAPIRGEELLAFKTMQGRVEAPLFQFEIALRSAADRL